LAKIHPFLDGNGRVGRALGYVVMCLCLRRDPGLAPLLPSQFAARRRAYLTALRAADGAPQPAGLTQLGQLVAAIWPPLLHCTWPPAAASSRSLQLPPPPPSSAAAAAAASAAASTAAEDMRAIREQLQCVICYEPMLDPITARCGHAYCKHCIVRWLRNPNSPQTSSRPTCPTCRAALPPERDLEVSVALRAMVERMHSPASLQTRRAVAAQAMSQLPPPPPPPPPPPLPPSQWPPAPRGAGWQYIPPHLLNRPRGGATLVVRDAQTGGYVAGYGATGGPLYPVHVEPTVELFEQGDGGTTLDEVDVYDDADYDLAVGEGETADTDEAYHFVEAADTQPVGGEEVLVADTEQDPAGAYADASIGYAFAEAASVEGDTEAASVGGDYQDDGFASDDDGCTD